MQATGSVIHFPKQQKSVPRKSCKSDPEKPKATVLEWVRHGFTFPGQPAPPKPLPPTKPPKPTPGPISVPPSPDKPEKGGA